MADFTTYKSLELPKSNEKYNVGVANKNAMVIDSELHKLDLKNESQDNLLETTKVEIIEKIQNETIRASNEENRIDNNLNAEIDRAISAEQNIHEIISSNKPIWDDKYTKNEIDNKFSTLETNIDWKESVESFDDIALTYPDPDDGWTVNVNDTDITYRFNGKEWISISANAIPKVTNDADGLLSKEDYVKYEDANSKKHIHENKSILDGITHVMITAWDNAVNHISDTIKHITSDERDNWNIAKEHAESDHARTDATKVEKSDINGNIKINGTEVNVYTNSEETNPQVNGGIYYSDTEPENIVEGMTWIGNEEETGEEGE